MSDSYRLEPPEIPPCPRCHTRDHTEPSTDGPWPWWCATCACPYTGSPIEAQNHAAAQLAEKAAVDEARDTARAHLERLRAQREQGT